jgi:tRNA(fMet)-specific endonuclease VapC
VNLRFLLDTNVVSEPLRPEPAPEILRRLRAHEGEIALPSVVWHELQFGCLRLDESRRRTAIENYLNEVVAVSFPVLTYDRSAAEWHARERARLTALGKTPPFVDGQIAAVACVNDLILVTANKSDFRLFEGLRTQRWR